MSEHEQADLADALGWLQRSVGGRCCVMRWAALMASPDLSAGNGP